MDEVRNVGQYEITDSFEIAGVEIVMGENLQDENKKYYMACKLRSGEDFESYDDYITSNDYLEVVEMYSAWINEEVKKMMDARDYRIEKIIVTEDMCDDIENKNIIGKVIAIRAENISPEYRVQQNLILRCINRDGSEVYTESFVSDERECYDLEDVLGIVKKEFYPYWLKKIFEREDTIKNNPYVFEYGGYHFLPVGITSQTATFNSLSRNIYSDLEFGICPKNSRKSVDIKKYNYDRVEFYSACNNIPCDIFRCVENNKLYIPGSNELFRYIGRYKKYNPKGKLKKVNLGGESRE